MGGSAAEPAWLVDAMACLLLNACILLQIFAEQTRSRGAHTSPEDTGDHASMRL